MHNHISRRDVGACRTATQASGEYNEIKPLTVSFSTNTLNFDWCGQRAGSNIGIMIAAFNITFKHLKFLPMGRKSLADMRKKNPDFMLPPAVLESNDKALIKLLRETLIISNPGCHFALPDGTSSPENHATLLFPLAGVSPHYRDYVINYVRDVAERTNTPFLDRTSDPALIHNANLILPTAKLLKPSGSELYLLNVIRMMPIHRFVKSMLSFKRLTVQNGKTVHAITAKHDVDQLLKLLRLLKINLDIRTA